MHKEYRSYDILKALPDRVLDNLEHDPSLGVYDNPFSFSHSIEDEELVEFNDIIFYNTQALSPAANHFRKHGVYTTYHPDYDRDEFNAFWDEEERRRKEGYHAPARLVEKDNGTWVLQDLYITGEHYGYLNYAPIKRVSHKVLEEVRVILDAGGEIDDVQHLVERKERDFPQFLDSDYYYFMSVELARKKARHLVVAKARRKGYSYKNGWLAADKADLYPDSVTGLGAFNSDSLYPGGTMTMADNYLQHIAEHTDWRKRRSIDKQDMIKFGYQLNDGTGIEYGYKSSIFCGSFAPNNPGALRGKDCLFMMLEESGKNPILSKVLSSTLPTLKAGIFVTGLMIVFGTGGGDDKQWEDFEDLFYFPSTEDFLSFNNIWDDDARGTECGFFVPSYMGKEGFFDEHGNSDVQGAIRFEERERLKRKKSRKASKLTDYVMEEPFTPREAFSRAKYNIFPTDLLEEQYRRVMKDPDIKAITRTGKLTRDAKTGKVKFINKMFMNDTEQAEMHDPIIHYPLKPNDDPHGCVTIWENPWRDPGTGLIPDNLYRIEHDPFALPKNADDVGTRDSLGACYVYQRSNNFTPGGGDRLVASFVGRPPTTDQYNDIMFMLAEYYNAIIQYENDRGDVYNYARENGQLHMLAVEPEFMWQKSLQGKTSSNRKKGIHINTTRKENGVVYLRDWLLEKRNTDEQGNKLLNLHYIYDPALLLELLKFNLKGNFDRISARIVGIFDKKENIFNEITKPQQTTQGTGVFDRDWF